MVSLDESALDEATHDAVARTVRDEQILCKVAHPYRTIVNTDLVQHVVVVE